MKDLLSASFIFKFCKKNIFKFNIFSFALKAYITAVYIYSGTFILENTVDGYFNCVCLAHNFKDIPFTGGFF